MKKYIVMVIIASCSIFINTKAVFANIMCNDGTESPTCSDCHQGCCSWHGGCASSRSSYSSSTDYEESDSDDGGGALVPLLVGGGGIAGAVAYNKSKKRR